LENVYGALNYGKDDVLQTVHFRPNQPDVALIYKKEKPEKIYLQSDSSIKAKTFQLSTLTFARDSSLVIEKNGFYYDQQDITTNGYLAFKKVGDMLPYNYGIKEVAMPVEEEIIKIQGDSSVVHDEEVSREEKNKLVKQDSTQTVNAFKETIIRQDENKPLTMDDIRKLFWEIEKKTYTQKELLELKEFLQKFLAEKGM
jgi:hypothetical protein